MKLQSGEVDYSHWRRAALRILDDDELRGSRKKNILLDSLTGRAKDIIELHRDLPADDIISVLDKTFGSTADATDLLANFFQILQKSSQSASEYLNELYIALCTVVKAGNIPRDDASDLLIKQFMRGTQDKDMLTKLRLDELEETPSYPDLIIKVRKEETRRTERRMRLKNASCSSINARKAESTSLVAEAAPKVTLPQDSVKNQTVSETQPRLCNDEVAQLRQRVAQLEKRQSRVFCYRCGEDGHMAYDCKNPPNKSLVDEKTAKRRSRSRYSGNGNQPSKQAIVDGKELKLGHF